MNSTIYSAYLLLQIIWGVLDKRTKLKTILTIIFTIFSSFLNYLSILITAFTFSFFASNKFENSQMSDITNLFGFKFLINNDSFFNIISIWLLVSILTALSNVLSTVIINKNSYHIGTLITDKILKISIDSNSIFHEKLSKKALFNILTLESQSLIRGSIMALISFPFQISIVIALSSIILKYSVSLFIFIPLLGILYLLITNLFLNIVRKNSVYVFNYRADQTDILTRFIENYLDVSFPPSNLNYRKIFHKITTNLRNKEAFNSMVPKILKSLLELLMILLIGFYCIYILKFLNMSVTYFISSSAATIISVLKLAPIISGISSNLAGFDNQYESIKKHYEIFKNQYKYNLNSDKYNYSKVIFTNKYSLSFNSISSHRIKKLNEINVLSKQFAKNKLIWITGKSGCGKSTLFSMIAGIRPITKGEIILELNKSKVRDSYSKNIYDYVAYMPQKPIFHSTTVRDYIRDGDSEIDDGSISKIINILELSNTFNVPNTEFLDLIIGPRGFSPSGGQAKILAFARTLCKRNIELYLLDEPTSDLNRELRDIVLNCIYNLSKKKFVLSITHDLTSIRNNDEIIKL